MHEPNLLPLPVVRSARLLALDYLAETAAAHARLADPDDAEALHDFRVGLRRLRSCERAFRSFLREDFRRRDRRRLRELAQSTGASRDAEVQILWFREEAATLSQEERVGADWLIGRLERRKRRADREVTVAVGELWEPVRARLADRLSRYTADVRTGGVTTSVVLTQLLQEHAAHLEARLAEVNGIDDQYQAHEARIAAKRLRYLLEPFADEVPEAAPLLKQLRRMQTTLGEMHDADVSRAELATAQEGAAPEAAQPGLAVLAERAEARMTDRFRESESEWLGGASSSFMVGLAAVAAGLSANRGDEFQRKFLLRGLPEVLRGHAAREIEEGWLPGQEISERLRRTRSAKGTERYFRSVALRDGISAGEAEERIGLELFAALWPSTEGRRLRKRRYIIGEGELTWKVDEFTDRELVLATVKLPLEDNPADLPAALRPFLVREVTEEPEYSDLDLAR